MYVTVYIYICVHICVDLDMYIYIQYSCLCVSMSFYIRKKTYRQKMVDFPLPCWEIESVCCCSDVGAILSTWPSAYKNLLQLVAHLFNSIRPATVQMPTSVAKS